MAEAHQRDKLERLCRHGGAMANLDGSSPEIFDTLISGNQSTSGAGMYNAASSPVLTNVTFSGNRAFDSGSAIQNFAASSPVIRNSIAWQNAPAGIAVISGPSSLPVMSYSLIEGCTALDLPDTNCPADGGGIITILLLL